MITLEPQRIDEPARFVTGRVLDPNGRPVVGATIEVLDRRDPAFTNNEGLFVLRAAEPAQTLRVRIRARGYAPVVVPVEAGEKTREIALQPGASVSGKLTRSGKPAQNVVLKALLLDRAFETFLGDHEAVTDENGVFFIHGLAPAQAYRVVTAGNAPVEVRTVTTGSSAANVELGAIEIP